MTQDLIEYTSDYLSVYGQFIHFRIRNVVFHQPNVSGAY